MLGSAYERAGLARAHRFLLRLGLGQEASTWRLRRELRLFCLSAIVALGGCASTGGAPQASLAPMFPESKWGVSASPRVASLSEPIPKGGGIYKVGDPYQVGGRWYDPREQPDYDRVGVASWYGADFHGRRTANNEIYDMNALTAAHPTLPMPSYAYVTNVSNGRTVLVRINDRGPYVGDRIIDLSQRTARELALEKGGTGRVRVRYAGRAPLSGDDTHEQRFLASRTWKQDRQFADAGTRYAPSAPRSYASPQRSYATPAWSPPAMREQASRPWSSADATAATQSRYAPAAQGWSPAAYRAGLVAR